VEAEGRFGVRPFAIDPEIAEALWAESVHMTGWKLKNERPWRGNSNLGGLPSGV
jgi:hypothetical protein